MKKNTSEVLLENPAEKGKTSPAEKIRVQRIRVQRIRNYRDFFGSPILLDFSTPSESVKTAAVKILDELEEKARFERKMSNPYYSFANTKKRASNLIKKIRTHPIVKYLGFR